MQILDNFESSFTKYIDARQRWESLDALKANEDILMPNGFQVFCESEQEWYQLSTTDETDPTTYVWSNISIEAVKAIASTALARINDSNEEIEEVRAIASTALAAADETGAINEDITANVDVGGISEGTTLESGENVTAILKKILVKYFPPKITITADKPLLNKKGTTITAPINLTAVFEKTVEDLISYNISGVNGTNKNGGSLAVIHGSDISEDTTFTATATDSHGDTTKDLKFEFVNPYYYGSISTDTITDFTGLTEEIVKKSTSKNVSYTASAKYLVFAYDSSYGNLTSIKDKNNFENLPAFNKTVKTIDGESYNVYISSDPITCNNFTYTFKI